MIVRPNIVSRYGVDSFPTLLFLLNSTKRLHYQGSGTIDSLLAFYNDVENLLQKDISTAGHLICPDKTFVILSNPRFATGEGRAVKKRT